MPQAINGSRAIVFGAEMPKTRNKLVVMDVRATVILSLDEPGASLNASEVKQPESYAENFSTDKYLKANGLFRNVK